MVTREDLRIWVYAAIVENGGEATVVEIAKFIWDNHEDELRRSGDLFYRWQYEMRWAGQTLQQDGKITKLTLPRKWVLAKATR